MRLAEKLNVLLEVTNLSQRDIAARVGVSNATVNRWTSGEICPRLDEAAKLADALGVPIGYLADESDERSFAGIADELRAMDVIGRIGWKDAYDRLVGAHGGEDAPRGPAILNRKARFLEDEGEGRERGAS
jgi:transcriptional regulator with XRE-family HTH domain